MKNNVTISKLVRGIGSPSYETLSKIKETYPELNMDWLISGEGEMILGDSDAELLQTLNERIEELKREKKIIYDALERINRLKEK